MEDKQDGIWSCKTITSYYNIFQKRQIPKLMYYQEKIKWILWKITRIFKYSRKKYGQERSQ